MMRSNEDEARINELIDMIDKLMANGGGHVNVTSEGIVSDGEDTISVQTFRSNDCGTNKGACCEPNAEFDDDDEF